MLMRFKTPEEIAKRKKKSAYNLYLYVSLMDDITELAKRAGISPSEVVNEAIKSYLEGIKQK